MGFSYQNPGREGGGSTGWNIANETFREVKEQSVHRTESSKWKKCEYVQRGDRKDGTRGTWKNHDSVSHGS